MTIPFPTPDPMETARLELAARDLAPQAIGGFRADCPLCRRPGALVVAPGGNGSGPRVRCDNGCSFEAVRAEFEGAGIPIATGQEHAGFALRVADLSKLAPPLRWLLRNVILASRRTLIAGEPGVGKTYLLLLIVACCAAGLPLFGLDRFRVTENPGPALVVMEEGSEGSLVARLSAIVAGLGFNLTDPEWTERICLLPPQGMSVLNAERWEALRGKVRVLKPSLIVLDPAALMMDGDHKDGGDVNRFLAAVGDLQRDAAGEAQPDGAAAVLCMHTTWQDKRRVGGAIQWRGGVDIELNYRQARTEDGERCARLSWAKTRDGEGARPMLVGLDLDRDGEGTPRRAAFRYLGEPSSADVEGPGLEDELAAFLAGGPRPPQEVRAEFCPGGKSTDAGRYRAVTRTLKAGQESGKFQKTADGWWALGGEDGHAA